MGGLVAAWLAGEGIIIYRQVRKQGGPPWPGSLLVSSGLFVALALLSEAGPGARRLATTLAWGFDAAAFMGLSQTAPGKGAKGWWPAATKNLIPNTQILPGGAQATSTTVFVNPATGAGAAQGAGQPPGSGPAPTIV